MADIRQGDDWDGGRGGYTVHEQRGPKMVTRYAHYMDFKYGRTEAKDAVKYLRERGYINPTIDSLFDDRVAFWTAGELSEEECKQIVSDLGEAHDWSSGHGFNREQWISEHDWAALSR